MSANPHANGGLAAARPAPARLPRLRGRRPGARRPRTSEATRVLGAFLRDVIVAQPGRRSACSAPTRPPPTGWARCSRSPTRAWDAELLRRRRRPRRDGRVMEVLSEHLCQGWLEGYLLTGRHGLFNCYEAFIHIIDSMFNQHAKWLKVTREIPWRRPIASLNYLLSSHVWRQDHNGFSHQDPGLHRPRRQQEGRDHPRLPAAGRQHPALGRRPLPAQPQLRERDRRRQAAGAELPVDGRGHRALHPRHRHLGVGVDRRRRRARRRARLRRRRADARDAGRGGDPARAPARPAGARRQRRRPDAPAARDRAPARAVRPRVRRAVHHRPAGRLRLPRLSRG